MNKYSEKLIDSQKIYEKLREKKYLLKNNEVEIVLEFKKENFMHLVGFKYGVPKTPAKKFYDDLYKNQLSWRKVYYTNNKKYTEAKLSAFCSFFKSDKFNLKIQNETITISYNVSNKRNAILEIQKNKKNECFHPKSFKKVNTSYTKQYKNVDIKKLDNYK